jgi:hypothetical protein
VSIWIGDEGGMQTHRVMPPNPVVIMLAAGWLTPNLKSPCLLHVVTSDLKPDLMRQAYIAAFPPVHDGDSLSSAWRPAATGLQPNVASPRKDGDNASLITSFSLGSGLQKRSRLV